MGKRSEHGVMAEGLPRISTGQRSEGQRRQRAEGEKRSPELGRSAAECQNAQISKINSFTRQALSAPGTGKPPEAKARRIRTERLEVKWAICEDGRPKGSEAERR